MEKDIVTLKCGAEVAEKTIEEASNELNECLKTGLDRKQVTIIQCKLDMGIKRKRELDEVDRFLKKKQKI